MNKKRGLILLILITIITCTVFIFVQLSPGHQAKETVDLFYSYEQEGNFADSWELFHSEMKTKFEKGKYLQDRAHVFMSHFGVTTFTYVLGDVEKIDQWQMTDESEPLTDVYRVTVTQNYKSKYGDFLLVQDVFTTEEEGEWKVLWNYRNR